jgi:hypothetical protein
MIVRYRKDGDVVEVDVEVVSVEITGRRYSIFSDTTVSRNIGLRVRASGPMEVYYLSHNYLVLRDEGTEPSSDSVASSLMRYI